MTSTVEFSRGPLTFRALDSGPEGGEPIVLLHGFPQRYTSWDEVAAVLTAQGYRTLALDQRGYCPTARPPHRRDYTLTELVGDVLALLDSQGLRSAHVVGHDWGAAVAWALAATHPDRVRTLTAVSVPHLAAFRRAMTSSPQLVRSVYMAFFQLPALPELVLSSSATPSPAWEKIGMTPDMLRAFREEVVDDGALTGGLNWYRALPFGSIPGAGRSITVPTTYVWSDRDVALDNRGAALTAEHVSGPYRYVEMTGVSHWIPDERPDELAGIVLDRVCSVV